MKHDWGLTESGSLNWTCRACGRQTGTFSGPDPDDCPGGTELADVELAWLDAELKMLRVSLDVVIRHRKGESGRSLKPGYLAACTHRAITGWKRLRGVQ